MRLMPQSIIGRTVVVLLAGLIVSHVISLAIYSGDRNTEIASAGGRHMSERIAAAIEAVEATPPEDRPWVVRSLWGPGFSMTWTEQSALADNDTGWRAHKVRKGILRYVEGLEEDRIRIAYRTLPRLDSGPEPFNEASEADPMMAMQHHMGRMMSDPSKRMHRRFATLSEFWHGGDIIEVSVRLSDGSWLNSAAPAVRFGSFWWSRMFLSIIVMTLLVTVVSVWAVRRSTAPLALFARAAERLGRDVNAPPLSEDGPVEVKSAAVAFNDMQRRLRAFVHDRTQMLAAISHDLRTPITRLRLRAELIEDEEQQRKMLDDLHQMEQMITATLSFARDDASGELDGRFDLAAMLQSLADDSQDVGGKAGYDGPESLIFTGRPMAIKRAFQNLVDNAVTYGGRAGIVLHDEPGQVVATIEDDGPGVPDDETERIFDPFYRLERSRSRETGGVGLGLAVARSVVRAHGGKIFAGRSRDGKFKMTVTLPKS